MSESGLTKDRDSQERFEHLGLEVTRKTSRRPREKTSEARQWRHGEFTQVQATLRCKTLLMLV